jgi:hypothetical protein
MNRMMASSVWVSRNSAHSDCCTADETQIPCVVSMTQNHAKGANLATEAVTVQVIQTFCDKKYFRL